MTGKTPTTPARGKADGGRGARDAVDYEVAQKALDVIRHRVKHYRMYLKPSFQDFDPSRKKKITRRQFLSVLGNINVNLSPKEMDAMCDRYTIHERSPGERVKYVEFCRDVDPDETAQQGGNSPTGL